MNNHSKPEDSETPNLNENLELLVDSAKQVEILADRLGKLFFVLLRSILDVFLAEAGLENIELSAKLP